jgi:hypothetical protein
MTVESGASAAAVFATILMNSMNDTSSGTSPLAPASAQAIRTDGRGGMPTPTSGSGYSKSLQVLITAA